MKKFLVNIPSFFYIFIVYNVLALLTAGEPPNQDPVLDLILLKTTLPSGALFRLDVNDLILMFAILALFIEIVKATRTVRTTYVDHVLSVLVFIFFLLDFILGPHVGNDTFFILMLMTLLDVVGGFSISIATAKRDFSVTSG